MREAQTTTTPTLYRNNPAKVGFYDEAPINAEFANCKLAKNARNYSVMEPQNDTVEYVAVDQIGVVDVVQDITKFVVVGSFELTAFVAVHIFMIMYYVVAAVFGAVWNVSRSSRQTSRQKVSRCQGVKVEVNVEVNVRP